MRSKTPDLVHQEFCGLMLAHFAIRSLMHEAALRSGEDPGRLSYVHAVRVVLRKIVNPGPFLRTQRPDSANACSMKSSTNAPCPTETESSLAASNAR